MAEKSAGKDTAAGHWEMTGLVTRTPFKVYSAGFPAEAVRLFEERIGRKVLGNKSASGTEILKELGEEHLRTGSPSAAVYSEAADGRPIFVLPWNDQILVGTTEVADNGEEPDGGSSGPGR